MQLLERLNQVGYERARRALAALALSLLVSLFLFVALLLTLNGAPEVVPLFVGFAVAYGVAFMGVAAEWFWGRWFAAGLGWSGLMIATASLLQIGEWNPFLGGFGAVHGLVILLLAGKKMEERYDLQPGWRERYGMDEFAVARLRKTVTRAAASLPAVIAWALGPKEPAQGLFVAGLVAVLLTVTGLRGVLRMRTWGLMALGGAATTILAFVTFGAPAAAHLHGVWSPIGDVGMPAVGPGLAAALLAAAILPFARPMARYLQRA